MDKSSSQELIISKNISWTQDFQAITVNGTIPHTGYLHLIFQVGQERYNVLFDTVREITQPFFCGQDDTFNFYVNLRIDSDTQISICVKNVKGYRLEGGFANKPIWLRTYYVT